MVFWRKKKDTAPSPEVQENATSELHGAESPESPAGDEPSRKIGWFRRVLKKTNDWLRTDIRDLWKEGGRLVDDAFLSDLYAILVRTDMGAPWQPRSSRRSVNSTVAVGWNLKMSSRSSANA
jgi:fused signal recognition particle receptor